MKLAIVISSPPMRQVFRGKDSRAVAIVVERALWPLIESDQPIEVSVQCSNSLRQAQLTDYFNEMIAAERSFLAQQILPGAHNPRIAKA